MMEELLRIQLMAVVKIKENNFVASGLKIAINKLNVNN